MLKYSAVHVFSGLFADRMKKQIISFLRATECPLWYLYVVVPIHHIRTISCAAIAIDLFFRRFSPTAAAAGCEKNDRKKKNHETKDKA